MVWNKHTQRFKVHSTFLSPSVQAHFCFAMSITWGFRPFLGQFNFVFQHYSQGSSLSAVDVISTKSLPGIVACRCSACLHGEYSFLHTSITRSAYQGESCDLMGRINERYLPFLDHFDRLLDPDSDQDP
jgi:hypothetical protein